jgi:hypothetical protein
MDFIAVMKICKKDGLKWCNTNDSLDFFPSFVDHSDYPGYIEVRDNVIGWLSVKQEMPDEFITAKMFETEFKETTKDTIKDELIEKLEEQVELLSDVITKLTSLPHLTIRQNESLIKKIESLKRALK